jgi:hypothetical protein
MCHDYYYNCEQDGEWYLVAAILTHSTAEYDVPGSSGTVAMTAIL